jgi:hypothetical protein
MRTVGQNNYLLLFKADLLFLADDDMDGVEEIVTNDTNTKDDNVDTKVNEDDDNDEDIKEEIEEDEKQLALREKALEVIGFLLELPREDMLPYFQEIGTSLSANFETQHDLGNQISPPKSFLNNFSQIFCYNVSTTIRITRACSLQKMPTNSF